MPPEAIAEPPQVVEPPKPPVQEPLKVKAGDRWKAEFEKLTKAQAEAPVADPPKEEPTVEAPKEPPKESPPTVPVEEKKQIVSPLDVVTADKKQEIKVEEPDVLKGIPEDIEAKDAKTKEEWKVLRGIAKKQSEEKKALETTIAELQKTPKTDPEEIDRLTKEREELQSKLAEREELIKSVDVRLSDEYRSLAKKRDDTLGKISSRAKSYGVDADALVSALALPDGRFKTEQIKGVMAEVDPDDKARINVLIETLDGHNEALFEFEKDAPKKYEEIQARREAALREQQEASVKAVHTEFGKITEALPTEVVTLREVPEDVPGGTEWNQAIKTARENALRVLSPGGSDFNESATIAYKGAHYDSLMNMFLKDHQELVDARKRLAEFDSGGPDFKGGEKPKTEPKLTAAQKYHRTMESLKTRSE